MLDDDVDDDDDDDDDGAADDEDDDDDNVTITRRMMNDNDDTRFGRKLANVTLVLLAEQASPNQSIHVQRCPWHSGWTVG